MNANIIAQARGLAGVVLMVLVSSAQLGAQPQRVQDSLAAVRLADAEARCRGQGPKLTRSTRRDSASMIVHNLARCPDAGPPELAKFWRDVGDDSLQVRNLVDASTEIRDMRVFQVVSDVAGDRSRPRSVRLGAISVMWYYADRTYPVFGTSLLNANPPKAIPGERASSVRAIDGKEPVLGNVRDMVFRRAWDLASASGEESYMVLVFKETAERYLRPPR